MAGLGIRQVIENNYCIGCGVCAHLMPQSIRMNLNEYGQFQAEIISDNIDTGPIDKFCPFSDASLNEDDLAGDMYSETPYFDTVGYYQKTLAGYVSENEYRTRGSSGGFGTWLASELLRLELVDAIIHVKSSGSKDLLFEYGISSTEDDLRLNAKSKYYPVKLDDVLEIVSENKGRRFLFIGIPCMVKAIRLLARDNPSLNESIVYTLGLVCGHIKSKAFSEMLGWQLKVEPRNLKGIDFRTKLEGYGSNQYGVTVFDKRKPDVPIVSKPVNELFGTNWGLGYFKSAACDFCDDVMAETADITIGDAWLPEYVNESAGTNIIVVRNKDFAAILANAETDGRICLDSVSPERTALSQRSGINHRRSGLQYRLYLNSRARIPTPKKRVSASNKFPRKFKRIQELRVKLRDQSHRQFLEAKEKDDYSVFTEGMRRMNADYAKFYRTPVFIRIARKLRRILKRI